jgi:hypothetical protein
MDAPATFAALDRLAGDLAADGDPTRRTIGDALARWLAGEAATFDEALGLTNGRGQSWRQQLALARRDGWLLRAAREFDLTAEGLAAALARYASSAWPRDREADACPSRLIGRPQEYLWRALKAWPRVIGERQIRSIIGSQIRFSLPLGGGIVR